VVSEFPSAYCRNKSMSVASCIHLSMAAEGKKCQPNFEYIPGTNFSTANYSKYAKLFNAKTQKSWHEFSRIIANRIRVSPLSVFIRVHPW